MPYSKEFKTELFKFIPLLVSVFSVFFLFPLISVEYYSENGKTHYIDNELINRLLTEIMEDILIFDLVIILCLCTLFIGYIFCILPFKFVNSAKRLYELTGKKED